MQVWICVEGQSTQILPNAISMFSLVSNLIMSPPRGEETEACFFDAVSNSRSDGNSLFPGLPPGTMLCIVMINSSGPRRYQDRKP